MWIRVPVHCQCRGHCPLRQPCHRARVGCQSRCQCVAAVTVPRERDERCPRGLCLPVGYCASTPGYPNSGIPAGIRNQESDSGMGPARSRFLIPVPSQHEAIRFHGPSSLSHSTCDRNRWLRPLGCSFRCGWLNGGRCGPGRLLGMLGLRLGSLLLGLFG